jgi:hypothetical protein
LSDLGNKSINNEEGTLADIIFLSYVARIKKAGSDNIKKFDFELLKRCLDTLNNTKLFPDISFIKDIVKFIDLCFANDIASEERKIIRSKYMVTIYEEGLEVGRQEGMQVRNLQLIARFLEKGKSHEAIRDDLALTDNEFQELLKMLENPDDSISPQ